MDFQLLISYKVVISTEEFRILSKALRGTLTEDEKGAALLLQQKMMEDRAKLFANAFDEANKTVVNIEKAKKDKP
jgi:hypothetical protein